MKKGLIILLMGVILFIFVIALVFIISLNSETKTIEVKCYDNHNNIISGQKCFEQKLYINGLTKTQQNFVASINIILVLLSALFILIGLFMYIRDIDKRNKEIESRYKK